MRNIFSIIILVLFPFALVFSNSSQFVKKTFYSESLKQDRHYYVSYPKGYGEDPNENYPVVIFLHGAGAKPLRYIKSLDPFLKWVGQPPLFSSFYKTIFVIPDGSVEPFKGSFYTNSVLYGNFEDYIYKDLVQEIRNHYQVSRYRQKWAIMGHSMGGYGAMKMALKHPELFQAVAALSAPLNVSFIDEWKPVVLAENGAGAPYYYSYDAGFISQMIFSLAGAFSPDTLNSQFVRFPLNEDGEADAEVMDLWAEHNVANYLKDYHEGSPVDLFFYCGTRDNMFTLVQNLQFKDSCKKYDVPYEFEFNLGSHVASLLTSFPEGLEFVYRSMEKATPKDPIFNSPNHTPFRIFPNPTSNFLYIEKWEYLADVKLYNGMGQLMEGGEYDLSFKLDLRLLDRGIYVLELIDKNGVSRKTRIIKI